VFLKDREDDTNLRRLYEGRPGKTGVTGRPGSGLRYCDSWSLLKGFADTAQISGSNVSRRYDAANQRLKSDDRFASNIETVKRIYAENINEHQIAISQA